MSDCSNAEMREALPELMHGRLDAAAHQRVAGHLATCADCSAELALLQSVRAAMPRPLPVDVARIVRALPRPVAAPAPRQRSFASRSIVWRIAAGLAIAAVGGLSVLVVRRGGGTDHGATAPTAPTARSVPASRVTPPAAAPSVAVVPPVAPPSARPAVAPESTVHQRPATPDVQRTTGDVAQRRAGITFGGGVGDLSDSQVKQLLAELDRLDHSLATEPEAAGTILPVAGGIR